MFKYKLSDLIIVVVKIPQGPYNYVQRYSMEVGGVMHDFYTLISQDRFAAWMPDNEQQHVNIGYNGTAGPVKLDEITEWDIAKMLRELASIKAKKEIPLEDMVNLHPALVNRVLQD